MGKFLFICWLSVLTTVANAQLSAELWHDGYLVTTDQDTLRGLIKYNMETNIVELIQNKNQLAFSSHKVFYFEIFDSVLKNYRQFYSIPYQVNYDYKIPIIFELIYEGPLSLLTRESVIKENVTNSSSYWGGSYVRERVSYAFYFLDKKGNIQYYTGKKNDIYMIMAKKASEIKTFIKKNKLQTDELKDLIRITAFYNSI